jgi:hypothetical protein
MKRLALALGLAVATIATAFAAPASAHDRDRYVYRSDGVTIVLRDDDRRDRRDDRYERRRDRYGYPPHTGPYGYDRGYGYGWAGDRHDDRRFFCDRVYDVRWVHGRQAEVSQVVCRNRLGESYVERGSWRVERYFRH